MLEKWEQSVSVANPCRQHLWRADSAIDYDLRKYKCQKEVTFGPLLLLFHPFLSRDRCQAGHALDLMVWDNCMAIVKLLCELKVLNMKGLNFCK